MMSSSEGHRLTLHQKEARGRHHRDRNDPEVLNRNAIIGAQETVLRGLFCDLVERDRAPWLNTE